MERQLKQAAGFSLAEIVVVLALVSLIATMSVAAWARMQSRSAVMQTARLVQKSVYQARMFAVYKGVNHFIVFDPTAKTVAVYQDSSEPLGALDPGDPRLMSEPWPAGVELALPGGAGSLPNPLGGAALTAAWSLPQPEGAGWSAGRRGVMATPWGAIAGCNAAAEAIPAGVIVFSDTTGQSAAVGIHGQLGSVHWFRLEGSGWRTG